jgi:2,3-diketo-5-methylthio-1-phosphopentane phosphatase
MVWRVFVDFDGTITPHDTADLILERFAEPEWRSVEDEWRKGVIGSRECMARQTGLIRVSETALDDFVADLAIDPTFPEFLADCQKRALPVAIVSDGFDRVIRAIARRHGFGAVPVFANELTFMGGDRWRLGFPWAKDSCGSQSGTCKCTIVTTSDRRARRPLNLLIGDGRSDFCAALEADFVFAKKQLLARCHEQGLPHCAFATFEEATRLLAMLTDPIAQPLAPHPQSERATNA